jgi:hypothetical protein
MVTEDFEKFEAWVEYCFTHGQADFHGYSGHYDGDLVAALARHDAFAEVPAATTASHMIRLFEDPGFIVDTYNDQQIGDATWFIFGMSGSRLERVLSAEVAPEVQVRLLHAIETMYVECFDRVCCMRGTMNDEPCYEFFHVDGAVYMIGDMGGFPSWMEERGSLPHCVDPILEVLTNILKRCRTSTCHISALHGLGHNVQADPERISAIIDRYLTRGDLLDWVRAYAMNARQGAVQ